MVRVRTFVGDALARFNGTLRLAAAWQGWPLTIIVLGTFGASFRLGDFIVYLLTVQTAIAASVADIYQRRMQEEDARRDARDAEMLKQIRRNGQMTLSAVKAVHAYLELALDGDLYGTRGPTTRGRSGRGNRKK